MVDLNRSDKTEATGVRCAARAHYLIATSVGEKIAITNRNDGSCSSNHSLTIGDDVKVGLEELWRRDTGMSH
jgi:hypothetical protein